MCPDYREALDDCIEEISWAARLGPIEATATKPTTRHRTKEILTIISLWRQVYPAYERSLRTCMEEIEETALLLVPKGQKVRARDVVLQAITEGFRTGPKIAQATGLYDRRVRRTLVRLQQLGLIRHVGCGALSRDDGYRTRLWDLTHSLPV